MARIDVKSEITGTVWKVTAKPGDKDYPDQKQWRKVSGDRG